MYKLTNSNTVVRISDGAFIPNNPENRDYAEYLAWLGKGGKPAPYEEPPAPEQQRAKRDALLTEADYAINTLIDNDQDVSAWRTYRQALRDVPQQPGFPATIDWPAKPN